jgi:hypothetical protein
VQSQHRRPDARLGTPVQAGQGEAVGLRPEFGGGHFS